MSPWDVRFDAGDRAFMDADGDGRFRLRVWTEPELGAARLVVRSGRRVDSYAMTAVASSERFTFWEVVAGPFAAGARDSFAFRANGGRARTASGWPCCSGAWLQGDAFDASMNYPLHASWRCASSRPAPSTAGR